MTVDTVNPTKSPFRNQDPVILKEEPKQIVPINTEQVIFEEKVKDPDERQNLPPVLEEPKIKMNAETMALLLIALSSKLGEEQVKTSKGEIQNNLVSKEHQHQEMIGKIHDFISEIEKMNETSLGMKILGWASAIITLTAAVVLTVATGGAAAPLLVAPLMMVLDMSLQEAELPGMGELLGKIYEACGMDKEDAMLAGAITYAAAMLITCVIVAVATGGVGGIALAMAVTSVATGGLNVAQGGLAIKKGIHHSDALKAEADQVDIKAMMKKLQAMMENEMGRLEEIIAGMDDGIITLLNLLGDVKQSKDSILGNMGVNTQMV